MEDANTRVQTAINKLVNDVDKTCLRKMQATCTGYTCREKDPAWLIKIRRIARRMFIEMFKCSAGCSENYDMSIHQVQECISRCNTPSERADQYLQSEMQNFQNRLQRCAMDCRDKAGDKISASSSEKDKQLASSLMEKCAVACVDSHLSLIPTMYDRIKKNIAQGN